MSKRGGVIRAAYAAVQFLFVCVALTGTAMATPPTLDKPIAVLRALDKVTARVQELALPMERPFQFGTLTITVHACRVTPPEDTPESAAFLDVEEQKPGEASASVFHGWMFASSPALSAMENPIYDLWVTGCADVPASGENKTPESGKG